MDIAKLIALCVRVDVVVRGARDEDVVTASNFHFSFSASTVWYNSLCFDTRCGVD